MNDINFDELDEAVNSVIGPDGENAVGEASQNSSEKLKITPNQRGRGQFMDMVHPSSDMLSNSRKTMKKSNPIVVQPLETEARSEDLADTPEIQSKELVVEDFPVKEVFEENTQPETRAENMTASIWPDEQSYINEKTTLPDVDDFDNLDKSESDNQPEVEANISEDEFMTELDSVIDTNEDETKSEEIISQDEENEIVETTKSSLTEEPENTELLNEEEIGSPFIETEVEKRPLSAFADVASSASLGDDGEDLANNLASEQSTEEDSREESADAKIDKAYAVENKDVIEDNLDKEDPSGQVSDEMKLSNNKETFEKVNQEEVVTSNVFATTIPQQYKTEQEEIEEEDFSVFDTEQYHRPLEPPERKNHTLLYVVIVMFMLSLGAVAVYMAMTFKII